MIRSHKIIILVPVIIFILVIFVFLLIFKRDYQKISIQSDEVMPDQVGQVEKPIGGERDEYGCLGPAGYSYNEEISACLREWELDEAQKKAARIAIDYLGYEPAMTVIEASSSAQIGDYFVIIEKGGEKRDRITVTIENWIATEKSITPDECEKMGGKITNIVEGETCNENQIDIGEVVGFITPAICCVEN